MKPLDPRLLRHARSARGAVATCVVLGVASAVLAVAQAEVLARAVAAGVDGAIAPHDPERFLGALTVIVIGRAGLAWVRDAASHRASAAAVSELRRKLVAHAAAAGPSATMASRAEIVTLAARGIEALTAYLGRYLPELFLAAIVPPVIVARLAGADLTAAIVVALTLPLIPLFMVLVGKATVARNAERWDELARLAHHFLDVASGLVTLKVFGRAKAQIEAVRHTTDEYRRATMGTLRVAFLSSLVLELVATLSVALVAVAVGLRLVGGGLDLRTALVAILLAPEAYLPLRQVGAQYHAAAEGLAAAERAFAVLEGPLPGHGSRSDIPDLACEGAVRVDGVAVAHAGRAGLAPSPVHFEARQGELVVLRGASGAGKSTLLAVLLGFVTPSYGRVVLAGGGDAIDLSELDPAAVRARAAWVAQAPLLFRGTVADNVRLARPEATDDDVRRALADAGLAAFDPARSIDEGGFGLSAGERRRVAIARALLRDAPLVLLDEPTAGLDAENERELCALFRRLARDRIVVMVSHRPRTVAAADRVVDVTAAETSLEAA